MPTADILSVGAASTSGNFSTLLHLSSLDGSLRLRYLFYIYRSGEILKFSLDENQVSRFRCRVQVSNCSANGQKVACQAPSVVMPKLVLSNLYFIYTHRERNRKGVKWSGQNEGPCAVKEPSFPLFRGSDAISESSH